jgi:hypothetical protein
MIRIILISAVLFIGCKNPNDRTCWKGSGEMVSEIRELPNKTVISIFDDADIILIQDSLNYIEIESYSNLVSFIETNSIDTEIEIRNLNRCNFIRDKDIENIVTIHYSNIETLNLNGTGKVTFIGEIIQNNLEINSYNSSSEFTLNISCHKLQCVFINGSINANINGSSDSTYLYQSKHSIVNASNLTNSYLHFSNRSTGDGHVGVTNTLAVELLDVGNIYYLGSPTLKILADNGLGNVISE